MVPGRYTALSNDKKMVTIVHRELERKVEKVKHMKLAPVVQTLDSAIHRINHYPVDKY